MIPAEQNFLKKIRYFSKGKFTSTHSSILWFWSCLNFQGHWQINQRFQADSSTLRQAVSSQAKSIQHFAQAISCIKTTKPSKTPNVKILKVSFLHPASTVKFMLLMYLFHKWTITQKTFCTKTITISFNKSPQAKNNKTSHMKKAIDWKQCTTAHHLQTSWLLCYLQSL